MNTQFWKVNSEFWLANTYICDQAATIRLTKATILPTTYNFKNNDSKAINI